MSYAPPNEWPTISNDPRIQARYVAMRENGEGHNLAEMFALRRSPTVKSDNTFFVAQDRQYESPQIQHYRAMAEAAGVDVNGAKYFGGLARFPGDPMAWKRSRGEIRDHCEAVGAGLTMDGSEVVKPRIDEPVAGTPLDPELLEDGILDRFDANPELEAECLAKPAALERVTEEVREQLTPHWHK